VFHQFICPITQEIMREPVIAEDCHTYEKEAIEDWLEKNPTSPMTRQPISAENLIPNLALKQLIAQWKEEQQKGKGKAIVDDQLPEAVPAQQMSPDLRRTATSGHFPEVRVVNDEEEEEGTETDAWRLMDEDELQAVLQQSNPDDCTQVRQQPTAAKMRPREGDAVIENGETPEEPWGTTGWLAFAGAVAVVAGGVAWAASTSTSSSSGEVKRKVRDEENSCILS